MFHDKHQYQWFHTGEFGFDETFELFGNFYTTDIKIIELKNNHTADYLTINMFNMQN